jgi:hypothetical protein
MRYETLEVSVADRKVFPVGGTVVRCALAGAILIALSACGSADPPAQPLPRPVQSGGGQGTSTAPTTGTPSTSTGATTGPAAVDRTDPLAVYRAWWAALEKALATANANEPSLRDFGANPLLFETQGRLVTLRGVGIVQIVHFALNPSIVARSTVRVDVADCVRGPAGSYRDATTGQPRAPANTRNDIPTHDSIRCVLQLVRGGWYVTAIQAGGKPC